MSLGQEVQISALVCDERALFEREVLHSGYELAAAYRRSISLGFARGMELALPCGFVATYSICGQEE
jgi:Tfp pilus assembly PilM family ATPase